MTQFFLHFIMRFLLLTFVSSLLNFGQSKKCLHELTQQELTTLSGYSNSSRLKIDGPLLKPILRKRVSGTKANQEVGQFIQDHFTALNWQVEIDTFKDNTPLGEITFNNIIATKNPKAFKRIVLAAHYDSKYFPPPNDNFVGATDSAVPCALLLDLATTLDGLLSKKKDNDVTLEIVFFDGEEAFENWNDTDSVYGARHLSSHWHNKPATSRFSLPGIFTNKIDTIEVFVLLDLLGSEGTPMMSLKKSTEKLFLDLFHLEQKILAYGLNPKGFSQVQFTPRANYFASIDDDHRPFEQLDVSILHLIPAPFPKAWHTLGDDASTISSKVVDHLALIFRAFVAQYLCLFSS